MKIIFLGAKVSVFQEVQINTSNQRLDELFITKQEQKVKNKNKIGLPPNKSYCLTPLARHKAQIDLGIVTCSFLEVRREFLVQSSYVSIL